MDSLGLLARLRAVTGATGEIIVSVRLTAPPSGHLVGEPAPVPSQDSVLASVLASLRPPSKDAPPAFRIHAQPGKDATIRVEQAILCSPEAERELNAPVTGRITSVSRPPDEPLREVRAKLRISDKGDVVAASIVTGSGYPQLDRAILESMRRQHFRPALLDGRPVEVWLTGARAELVR